VKIKQKCPRLRGYHFFQNQIFSYFYQVKANVQIVLLAAWRTTFYSELGENSAGTRQQEMQRMLSSS
jgi:hypothetical protein